jgi:ATP-dependent RNA helicase DDX55/SPB4
LRDEKIKQIEADIKSKKDEKTNRTRKEKKDAKIRVVVKDWDDLADDDRLFKKFKRGKISKEEYEKSLMKIK